MLVYLADLRHKTITLTPDAMPLSIGYLAAYASKIIGSEFQFKLFTDADHLLSELKHKRPDVLALCNYMWNYSLHRHAIEQARSIHPDILTLMGGPNIPLSPKGEEYRLRNTAGLDVHIINEGEDAFVELLSKYSASGLSRKALLNEPLTSSIFVHPQSGALVRGSAKPRMRVLDDIPSPYLMGIMDQFFDGDFCPMIQTNRGCPFTCTFCVEGVNYMTKVNKFSADRVREELAYIGHHTSVGSALMISDSNFGMLPGDMETAQAIHDLQKDIKWPQFVWATTGKNNKEAIVSAMDLMGGSMSLSTTVQSMDPTVLTNIKRTNIKLETYSALLNEVKSRDLLSYAEVIIGLPGETRESFLSGVSQLLDSQVQRVCCYQLMLLDGTELSDEDSRNKYGMQTKFRVLSRDFGVYGDQAVFETEEVVVATNTMTLADYMDLRRLQLIMEIYHREGLIGEYMEFLSHFNVSISQYVMNLLQNIEDAPMEVRDLLSSYMSEAESELFDSPEAVRAAMLEKYQDLLAEDLGGNLVQKYSAQAWFKTLGPILDYASSQAQELVKKTNRIDESELYQIDNQLNAIKLYILSSMIDITNIDNEIDPIKKSLEYDVMAWKNGGYGKPLAQFSFLEDGCMFVFDVSDSHSTYLKDKLRMHGESTQAMGKLLSRVVLKDIRRRVNYQDNGMLQR